LFVKAVPVDAKRHGELQKMRRLCPQEKELEYDNICTINDRHDFGYSFVGLLAFWRLAERKMIWHDERMARGRVR